MILYDVHCTAFIPLKILLLLVIHGMLHAMPSTTAAIPDEQPVVYRNFVTKRLNVSRIVEENRVSNSPTEIRVERSFVLKAVASNAVEILNHDFMDLKVAVSEPIVANNGWRATSRYFPMRYERYKFMEL